MKQIFDLAVVGAGITGICAAIAAARRGLHVALINDRPIVGGVASSEFGPKIMGASHYGLNPAIYAKETGIIEEIRLRLLYYERGGGYGKAALTDAVLLDMLFENPNISLFMNTFVFDCKLDNERVSAVMARHLVSNEESVIYADFFADTTGNGIFACKAGCAYRKGRESKQETGEALAPDQPDPYTMGNSLLFETEDVGHEVQYTPPSFAYDISKMDFIKDIDKPENFRGFSVRGPHWTYEYGGQIDIIKQFNDVDMELRRLIYGIWNYIKNSNQYPEAKNYVLKRVYARSGFRESIRLMGPYLLLQNDIESRTPFEDAVCSGGWPLDVHAPFGIYDKGPAADNIPVTGLYNIPLRCMYPVTLKNLYFAGRNASVSHVALGSTRIMATCGAMGQAIGTAAALSKKYKVGPANLVSKYIADLQDELLKDDQTIIGVKEKNDIMTHFLATASSTRVFENPVGNNHMSLERDYCLSLMIMSNQIDFIQIKCKNNTKSSAILNYKILHGEKRDTFLPEMTVAQSSIEIGAEHDGWVTLPIHQKSGLDGKVYIVFEKNMQIDLYYCEIRPIGAITFRMHNSNSHDGYDHRSNPLCDETGYMSFDHRYETMRNILFRRIIPEQNLYAPNMVLNNYSRPYGIPNLWIPDGNLPQTLILKTDNPVNASEIIVIFDSYLENDLLKEIPSCLVKNYTLMITSESGFEQIQIKENWKRYTRHPINIKGIREIEIVINETWGGSSPGIYAIKLVEEKPII